MSFEDVPEFLRPRLRLFLSIDLVGSTAFKQGGVFPIQKPKHDAGIEDVNVRWLPAVSGFYKDIQEKFAAHWDSYCDSLSAGLDWKKGEPPQLWKSNGDELVYVKDLVDSIECFATISCWLKVARDYRNQLRKKKQKLDVKLAAWTAGFPISNTEVIFQSLEKSNALDGVYSLPEYVHFHLLDTWHNYPEERVGLVRDFIGPSMDTGFRIAAKSTSRKFMISAELALLIASVNDPLGHDDIDIYFDGSESLKGVLGGNPYPLFWIDTLKGDSFSRAEDDVKRQVRSEKSIVRNFCNIFIKRNEDYMLYPFIVTDADPQLRALPPNYKETIECLANWWQSVKENDKARQRSDSDEPPVEKPGPDTGHAAAMDLSVKIPGIGQGAA